MFFCLEVLRNISRTFQNVVNLIPLVRASIKVIFVHRKSELNAGANRDN
jgi:hypothetical protein